MKTILFILIILLTSCNSKTQDDWKTIDLRVFKVKAPVGWEATTEQGIDTYQGCLTNGRDSLCFCYGQHCPSVGDEDPNIHKLAKDTINGLLAQIVIPIVDGNGEIAISIDKLLDGDNKFIMSGTDIIGTDTVLKIFKSLWFSESDSSKISLLTLDEFKYKPTKSGIKLYKINCASCHRRSEQLIGTALQGIATRHTLDWTYNFLTNRSSLKSDTSFQNLRKGKDYHCPEFPELRKEEVENIIEYIN